MADRKWLPGTWLSEMSEEGSPLSSLRKQIDNLFEDFGGDAPFASGDFTVRTNVSETDEAVTVTAELPGIELDDIDVSVAGNQLTVSGEKKSEKEEKSDEEGREFHRIERRSGSFRRLVTLPFEIEPGTVEAATKDGVLTVSVPKPPEAVKKSQRIEVTKA